MPLTHMAIKHRNKPALMLRQHGMAGTRQGLFQRAPLCQGTIEVRHERWTEVVLQREWHGNHSRDLRAHQRGCQRCVYGSTSPRLAWMLFQQQRGFTSREDRQADITTEKEIAQGLGADVAAIAFLVTETQIGLDLDFRERCTTMHTFVRIGAVELATTLIRAQASIASMAIEVDDVTGQCCLVIIQDTDATL